MMHGFGVLWYFVILFGLLLAVALLAALIIGVVWLSRRTDRSTGGSHTGPQSARGILDERYARGEISREEYLDMRDDLGTGTDGR